MQNQVWAAQAPPRGTQEAKMNEKVHGSKILGTPWGALGHQKSKKNRKNDVQNASKKYDISQERPKPEFCRCWLENGTQNR